MSSELLKLYEIFEKKLGKEEAKKAIELVEKAIQSVKNEAQAQKPILKAEIRDELRKELATKEDIAVLEEKIESVRREMRILFYVLLAFMVLLNMGLIK